MKKLHRYLSLSSLTIMASAVEAGVVYTNVDPDVLLDGNGETYEIDLNSDGNIDFTLEMDMGGPGYGPPITRAIINGNFGNQVAGYQTSYGWFTNTMAGLYGPGNTIYSGLDWMSGTPVFGFYFDGWSGAQTGGQWENVSNGYAALKFSIGTSIHYGWARFDIGNQYESIVLKDYAYNDTPNASIEAGATYNVDAVAQNIMASDVANFHNGLDLQVTFTKANNETGISNYRVIAVKEQKAGSFDINDANACAHFQSVTPTGSDITTTFTDGAKDSDGDLIAEDVSYKIFVLSVPDLTNSFNSNLPPASEAVVLRSAVGISELKTVSVWASNGHLFANNGAVVQNVQITNLSGQVIAEWPILPASGVELSLTGMYLVRYEVNGEPLVQRVML